MSDERTRWPIAAARAADDRLGTDTMVIDVGEVLAITEFFVITTGSNNRQVRAIAESVEEYLTDQGGPKPLRVEGLDSMEWVLLDFGDFVVHVLHDDARAYYQLERLWRDQPRVAWEDPDATRPPAALGTASSPESEEE